MKERILKKGLTKLHTFDGSSVTCHRYVDEVLEPHVNLFRSTVGPNVLAMVDDARSFQEFLVSEYLKVEDTI